MGWTHNWQRPTDLPAEGFAVALRDCRRILDVVPVDLAGPDGSGQPILEEDRIEFNGRLPEACEPFRIQVHEHDRRGRNTKWSFCKTEHMPYDLCVQCTLIVLKEHLKDNLTIGSDGSDQDWETAKAVVSEHLGYGADFRLAADV